MIFRILIIVFRMPNMIFRIPIIIFMDTIMIYRIPYMIFWILIIYGILIIIFRIQNRCSVYTR